jgi:uncharacterized tellurite resistance protein B-like protein
MGLAFKAKQNQLVKITGEEFKGDCWLMLDTIKQFFNKISENNVSINEPRQHDVRVAACALFVEIASIDETFTPKEMETVLSILKDRYQLSREHADVLIAEAEKELENSVDLWQFARLINENYSNDEKMELVEMLWRIVYVDGKMDDYEHYLMNKLKNLLRLSHDQLISAKRKVLHANDQNI